MVLAILPTQGSAQSDIYSAEAKKLVERLSGTKLTADNALVLEAADKLRMGDRLAAAQVATRHPNFLNLTVKLMALKMSSREETIRLLLNDFAADFIGVVRDNRDARELLTGNFYYAGDLAMYKARTNQDNIAETDLNFVSTDEHYQNLENSKIDIGQILVRRDGQKIFGSRKKLDGSGDTEDYVADNPDAAGVLTSRAFMKAHADAGTNRRPVEFAFREFMCVPLEQWAEAAAPDTWVGRDIDRFPGGDHQKYQVSCRSCHTGMDSLRAAFAHWDFDEGARNYLARLPDGGATDTTTKVVKKMLKNANVFPGGYVIKNSMFVNNVRTPANEALFGWRGPSAGGGAGVKGLGTMIANSKRFSQCMVKRVYDAVCKTNLDLKTEMGFVQPFADRFESRNYNLKELFEQVAIQPSCLGSSGAQ